MLLLYFGVFLLFAYPAVRPLMVCNSTTDPTLNSISRFDCYSCIPLASLVLTCIVVSGSTLRSQITTAHDWHSCQTTTSPSRSIPYPSPRRTPCVLCISQLSAADWMR